MITYIIDAYIIACCLFPIQPVLIPEKIYSQNTITNINVTVLRKSIK